jgi:hypothetical protein
VLLKNVYVCGSVIYVATVMLHAVA